jgi:Ca2+-binding RTX toxin-like protein
MGSTSYINADGRVLSPSGSGTRWISGTAGGQTLVGDNGNDIFWDVGNGNTLIGGTGSNTFNIVGANDLVIVPVAGGVNTVISWTTAYTLPANIQNLTLSYSGQSGTGNAQANIITAGTGAETLDGGGGSDVLVAGSGSDTFVVRSAYAGSAAIVGFKPGIDHVQLVGFTNLLTMLQVSAALSQVGADAVLNLGNASQLVFRNTTASQLSAADFGVPLDASGLILNGLGQVVASTAVSNKWLSATSAGQIVTGDNNNDCFWGVRGGNTFIAGTGSNTFNLQNTADIITVAPGGGVNTALLWTYGMTYTLPALVQNLTLEYDGQVGIGNAGNNILRAGAGAETLDGGGGSDAFIAGTGADSFIIKGAYVGSDSISGFKNGIDQVELDGFANFRTFADVSAAMSQVGTDAVLALGNGNTLVFRYANVGSFSAADFRLSENVTGLTQTFGAEFDTFSSSPDGSSGVWRTSLTHGLRTLASNGEIEYYNDASTGTNPFSITSGALNITAQQGPNPGGATWSSGVITTQNSFSQLYGVFEMRAQLPVGAGMWPAFWLLPANGTWPPELDVMERVGSDPGLIHEFSHSAVGGPNVTTSFNTRVADTTAGFHTYAVDWEPTTITWYVDGYAIASAVTPADMHVPMYMLANLAVGGAASYGGTTNASTPTTTHMLIDDIRVYASPATPTYAGASPGDGTAVPITPVTIGAPVLSAAQMIQVTALGGDGTVVPIGTSLMAALPTGDQMVVMSKAALSSTVVQQSATAVVTGFQDAGDAVLGQHDFLALTGFSAKATLAFDHLGTVVSNGQTVTDAGAQYYALTDTDGFSATILIQMTDGPQHLGPHAFGFI